jgi:hypothetical protein
MVGENDLPALPKSFHDAPDAFADVDADVDADMEADLEADVADVSTHGGGDFGGDFGEGFEAPVDVAPPPGFHDSNAEHTPATDASAIALAALQAALHADRAAHSQAAQAMSAASADTHAMKRAEAKIHAAETKIHAAMDERLALLERCFADQIENLRKAVETGDAEREVLRGRVETLEATLATKEGRRDVSTGVPVYSCPPLDPGERLGHPSSPPPAPRGTRPPPVVIDVEDVPCPPSHPSHQPSHAAPEGVQGARDDDVDEMREDEDTETPTETTEEDGAEESFYLSADDDADEFELTLAGFRSEPAKVVTAQPAALAKNPFEGLMEKDEDADTDADADGDEEEEDVAKVVVKRREGTSPTSPLSPPKHRGSAASSRETSLDEETVEEALAAIAREEDEARKRRTKKSRKKGSGGKKSAAEKREAKVAAYLQKKVEAKNEIATDAKKKKKKNRGVSWADEAPVTVPTTAVTGERIRMLHSARIHMTEAQRTRLAAVFGPDTVA